MIGAVVRLENSFEVAAPAESAWALLMDVPRVIPCIPGAELVETVDDSAWRARVRVKLGPMSLTFLADVKRDEVDEAAQRVRLATNAREERGRGAASATIESSLAQADGRTRVDTVTELTLTGPVAQYGRGIVQDVAGQMLKSFADCLEKQLAASPEEARTAVAEQQKPISGLTLARGALGAAISRLAHRLTHRHRE
jgi:carbon monoxide dehydrogenase subunit G